MKLVPFQPKYSDSPLIYINAAKVVAIQLVGNDTWIHVDVPNSSGVPFWYVVSESLDDAARKLAG